MSKKRSISTTTQLLCLATLMALAPGFGLGCICEDEPIKLDPPALPKLPPPVQRAVKAPVEKPALRATPEDRARAVYGRLIAALAGTDDLALVGIFAPSLRQKHGDKALLSTLRAHAKRHGAEALDPLTAQTKVSTQAGGKLRIVAGHTTCEFTPQAVRVTPAPTTTGGKTKTPKQRKADALPAPLRVSFLGVRSDLRFETYTVLLVSSEGLLSTAGKLHRKGAPRRELLRVGGKK